MYINPVNWDLLNRADYEDFNSVKEMLVLYNTHKRNALKGCSVSHSILIDLNEAIYSGILTKKQLEAVELVCMHNKTYESVAVELKVSHVAIVYRIKVAAKAIQKILLSGNLYKKPYKNARNLYCNIEGGIYHGRSREMVGKK